MNILIPEKFIEHCKVTLNVDISTTTFSTITRNRIIKVLETKINTHGYYSKVTQFFDIVGLEIRDSSKDRYNRLTKKQQKDFTALCATAGYTVSSQNWDILQLIRHKLGWSRPTKAENKLNKELHKRLIAIAPPPIYSASKEILIQDTLYKVKNKETIKIRRNL